MEISEIRARLPLARVLSHYGWEPDARGRMRCPFHDDKTPSLQTYPDTGTVYCFAGGCPTHGRSLDVIDIIKQADGCTKHEAILRAKAMAGALPKPVAAAESENRAAGDEAARAAVLKRVWATMRSGVALSTVARGYLGSRGLDHKTLDRLGGGVGYNSGQMHHGERRDGALIASCVRYGLLSETGRRTRGGEMAYRPFAKGSIAFALRTAGGEIGGLYFRSVDDRGGRHYYLRDRRGLYPRWPATHARRVLVCESVIDAASVLQHAREVLGESEGWAVLALYGTNGWTGEHGEGLGRLEGLEEVCLMLDADAAGRRATATYAEKVRAGWPGARVTSAGLPEGADANAVLLESGAGALAQAVADRREVGAAGVIGEGAETATTVANPATPDARASGEEGHEKVETGATKAADARLDESDPYDLGYGGRAARYRVKGYRPGQTDSLKVTLQIVTR